MESGLCRNGETRRLYIEGWRQRWQEQAVGALGMELWGGGGLRDDARPHFLADRKRAPVFRVENKDSPELR